MIFRARAVRCSLSVGSACSEYVHEDIRSRSPRRLINEGRPGVRGLRDLRARPRGEKSPRVKDPAASSVTGAYKPQGRSSFDVLSGCSVKEAEVGSIPRLDSAAAIETRKPARRARRAEVQAKALMRNGKFPAGSEQRVSASARVVDAHAQRGSAVRPPSAIRRAFARGAWHRIHGRGSAPGRARVQERKNAQQN